MTRTREFVQPPEHSELVVNTDDIAVTSLLSRQLGIPENRTEVAEDYTRNSYEASIKHSYYYLFQKQGLVTNKDQLFYRQNERYQPQAIKDTLPILLGASTNERYELQTRLRTAQRDLRAQAKLLEQAMQPVGNNRNQAISTADRSQGRRNIRHAPPGALHLGTALSGIPGWTELQWQPLYPQSPKPATPGRDPFG